jgi:hypothetical protein
MKQYEEMLDATENAMLADRLTRPLPFADVSLDDLPQLRIPGDDLPSRIARIFASPHRFTEPQHR